MGDLPSYAHIAQVINARADHLPSLWARTEVGFGYIDEDGKRRRDQGEGHLQYAAPDRIAVRIGKLGDTYFYLGCNAQAFFWIDLYENSEAWIGRHDELISEYSIGPVHPRDLIQLLGVTRIPDKAPANIQGPIWTKDQQIQLDLPTPRGYRRLVLDPARLEPSRVALLDESGAVLSQSELFGYGNVPIKGSGDISPRVPNRIEVTVPDQEAEIRLRLHGTEIRPINKRAFDFDALRRAYRVKVVHMLDELQ